MEDLVHATRISDYTAFFQIGEIVEVGPTNQILTHPKRSAPRITLWAVSVTLPHPYSIQVARMFRSRAGYTIHFRNGSISAM
jgi:ABC-type dipeptide/oligopeptide/nickel transport system ATPase component